MTETVDGRARAPAAAREMGGEAPLASPVGASQPADPPERGTDVETLRRGEAMARVLAVLSDAADAGAPCPSNRALCAATGIVHEAGVSRALAGLCRRGLIDIEWTVPGTGLRRVAIRASGRRTGWSCHGRRLGPVGAPCPPSLRPEELARVMARAGGRFTDVTAAEARRIARGTPPDPGLPPMPAPSSYIGSPLARLLRDEPDGSAAGDGMEGGV